MSVQKQKKRNRPIPRTPRGFKDVTTNIYHSREHIIRNISAVYEKYGFDFLETSAVETVESLGKFLPDTDRPNEGIFAWKDEDETWLALRYDHTAPLARFYAENINSLPSPFRRYSYGPVWRNEKPGPDRFRQFYQMDADTVGSKQIGADAEMCMMLCDSLESIGINFNEYTLRLNNRKILSGIVEKAKITDGKVPDEAEELFFNICRVIDKLDRLGIEAVKMLLGPGREDTSGDYTKGLNLSSSQIDFFSAFLKKNDSQKNFFSDLRSILKGSPKGNEGLDELEKMAEIFSAEGYSESVFSFDPTVVRGLGYYTGPVYEVELNRRMIDPTGKEFSIGSIAGGGRYDGLVRRFTGQDVPATGISIGIDRLLAILKIEDKIKKSTRGPIIVTVMDKERFEDYQKIVTALRKGGLRAEIFLGNPKDLGRQLKYADQRESPFAVIQGSLEAEKGTVQVKDLILGSKFSQNINTNDEWKEHPSQFEVKLDDLVEVIKSRVEVEG